MTYPRINSESVCAECGEEIKERFVTIRDNFMIVKFFQFEDGQDNIFCDNDCLANYLSVEEVVLEESEAE